MDGNSIEVAELVTAVLIGNAVKAVGFVDDRLYRQELGERQLLLLRLRLIGPILYVEVVDSGDEPPMQQTPSGRRTGDLLLVERLSRRWGYFHLEHGGKVVWAEVGVTIASEPADKPATGRATEIPELPQLPKRTPTTEQIAVPVPEDEGSEWSRDTAVMRRVLRELRKME